MMDSHLRVVETVLKAAVSLGTISVRPGLGRGR